jgi:poly [ADP-ribose] polymerase
MTTSNSKTIIYPIDSNYSDIKGASIFQHDDDAYTCTLNQTSIEDNKNKFYIMQVIEKNKNFVHFIRYGRIGEIGKISTDNYTDAKGAVQAFEKQFKLKTGNAWKDKKNFVKKEGKYFLTETIYEVEKSLALSIASQPKQKISSLDVRVQQLMKFISNVETMNKALIELNIDVKKMPLGKLSKTQLDRAHDILKSLSSLFVKQQPSSKLPITINIGSDTEESILDDEKLKQVHQLSSEYYTYIPYSCGRRKPPLIDSIEKVGDYTALLDDLRQIEVAIKISDTISMSDDHPLDTVYKSLKTSIKSLDKNIKNMCKVLVTNNYFGMAVACAISVLFYKRVY